MYNVFKKRIDELGRIVIPKQIRNIFKINNFDELELFVENDSIILKKSIGIEMYKEKLERFLNFIKRFNDFDMLVVEGQKVVFSTYNDIVSGSDILVENNTSSNDVVVKFNNSFGKITEYLSYCLPIIIDSNTLGQIYFINNKLIDDKELLKEIRDLIIDLIN